MRRKLFSLDKEAGTPNVGIFWLYKGQIIDFMIPVSETSPVGGGFRDSPYEHQAYWGSVQSRFPELRGKEYYDIPRGRIAGLPNGTYNILLPSRQAANPVLVQQIVRRFQLPPGKISAVSDVHYDPPPEDFDDI
jgi:hypothetical protein